VEVLFRNARLLKDIFRKIEAVLGISTNSEEFFRETEVFLRMTRLFKLRMPLRRIGEKIVEGKNDSSVSTQNFLIIYIFL
jgi:hypothetical protein